MQMQLEKMQLEKSSAAPLNPPDTTRSSWLQLVMREPEPDMKWPAMLRLQAVAASGK